MSLAHLMPTTAPDESDVAALVKHYGMYPAKESSCHGCKAPMRTDSSCGGTAILAKFRDKQFNRRAALYHPSCMSDRLQADFWGHGRDKIKSRNTVESMVASVRMTPYTCCQCTKAITGTMYRPHLYQSIVSVHPECGPSAVRNGGSIAQMWDSERSTSSAPRKLKHVLPTYDEEGTWNNPYDDCGGFKNQTDDDIESEYGEAADAYKMAPCDTLASAAETLTAVTFALRGRQAADSVSTSLGQFPDLRLTKNPETGEYIWSGRSTAALPLTMSVAHPVLE